MQADGIAAWYAGCADNLLSACLSAPHVPQLQRECAVDGVSRRGRRSLGFADRPNALVHQAK